MSIYIIPALTIIAAWSAVSIPLYFLFRPKQLQSLWSSMSTEMGQIILKEVNTGDVASKMINPTILSELTPAIETHIDQFLRVKLLEKMPFLATFLGESTLVKLKTGMMEEIELLLPEVMEQYINKSSSSFSPSTLISEKLNKISIDQVENAIKSAIGSKIHTAKCMAVCIGLIIGLIQIAIISL
jgi:uncharacterized membrane protein YheB (UPF0754 family)